MKDKTITNRHRMLASRQSLFGQHWIEPFRILTVHNVGAKHCLLAFLNEFSKTLDNANKGINAYQSYFYLKQSPQLCHHQVGLVSYAYRPVVKATRPVITNRNNKFVRCGRIHNYSIRCCSRTEMRTGVTCCC